jgi:putative spermidine/putrescine transport system ATP-binding protein
MIAGFVRPTAGDIFIAGRQVGDVPPYGRNCGIVFQNYALFPHLTAFENVAYGLRVRGLAGSEVTKRVGQALEMVRMAELARRYPKEVSGGQQQRIALARALVIEPSVLLLDEPLSNLDAKLRVEMRSEIRALVASLRITTIFVTHDQEESLTMSDRIVVMNQGVIEQVGTAEDIYERPATAFVATFVGTTNLVHCEVITRIEAARYRLGKGSFHLEAYAPSTRPAVGVATNISIRPERIRIVKSNGGEHDMASPLANTFLAKIISRTYIGPTIRYHVVVVNGFELLVDQQNRDVSELNVGDRARVSWNWRDALILKSDSPN